jgi:hydrogenase-4 component B
MTAIEENEYFPKERKFETQQNDGIQVKFIEKPISKIVGWLKKLAVMQTGQIQHYILYAFVFMLVIFLLTYFNLI